MKITPAVLERNVADFEKTLSVLASFSDSIQIDFNDGSFEDIKTINAQEAAPIILPHSKNINFEAHLMVQKPFDYIPKLAEAGVRKFIIQFEIEAYLRDILDQLQAEECLVGIGIGPETTIVDVEPFLELVDFVNILPINPGRQGQPLLPENLEKITQLRDIGFAQEIEVDGGIDLATIEVVKGFNPDTLVVGHYIVKAENPRENYDILVSKLDD